MFKTSFFQAEGISDGPGGEGDAEDEGEGACEFDGEGEVLVELHRLEPHEDIVDGAICGP